MFDIPSLAEFEGPTRVPHALRLNPICTHRCAVVPSLRRVGSRVSSFLEEHDTHNTCCMMDKKTRDADAAGAVRSADRRHQKGVVASLEAALLRASEGIERESNPVQSD